MATVIVAVAAVAAVTWQENITVLRVDALDWPIYKDLPSIHCT